MHAHAHGHAHAHAHGTVKRTSIMQPKLAHQTRRLQAAVNAGNGHVPFVTGGGRAHAYMRADACCHLKRSTTEMIAGRSFATTSGALAVFGSVPLLPALCTSSDSVRLQVRSRTCNTHVRARETGW